MYMTYNMTALLPNSWAQWQMVHCGTPRVGPIHTQNIGPVVEGLVSISGMAYQTYSPVKKIKTRDISYNGPLPNSSGSMADGPFRGPKGRSDPHPNIGPIE